MSPLELEDVLGSDSLEVVIDDYGYKGEGYVELEDGWLSVPGACPGERVRVDVDGETTGGRRVFGRVESVLEPADERRDPLCEKFAECNGCQLRHVSIPEELRFKRRTVREVVEKYAGLEAGEQPEIETITPRPIRRGDAFRIRSRLTYRTDEEGAFELGLVTPRRSALISMRDCPALTGSTRRLVEYVERALDERAHPPPAHGASDSAGPGIEFVSVGSPTFGRGLISLAIAGCSDEEDFDSFLDTPPVARFLDDLADRLPEDVGLAVRGAGVRRSVSPPGRITLPLGGLEIQAGYDDWFPATLEPTDVLYETLREDLLDLRDDAAYLDVGCGVGTLSLLAAPEVDSVTGIDNNRHSIEAAELNAVRNDVENVEFLPSGWEKALRQLVLDERSFDVATINPMREPLGERPLAYLHQLEPKQIVYLGPSPEAASKDLGVLRQKSWRITRLAAANVHPATYHTLLVAELREGAAEP